MIEGNEVRFVSGQSLDYETQSTYSVRVRATDQTGKYVEKAIELAIENAIEIFDYFGDGSIGLADFNQFRNRFGRRLDFS